MPVADLALPLPQAQQTPPHEAAFHCLVCAGTRSRPFLTRCADLYLHKPVVVDYHQCQDCELVQQHPVPDDVAPFYDAYPIHRSRSGLYSWFRQTLMGAVYRPPKQWPAKAKLLDFGCGDGWYLEACHHAGLDVTGFEYNAAHATALSARLSIPVLSDLDDLGSRFTAAFDVITLHFVVEHLTDLRAVFRRLATLLAPGGVLRYVVPNIGSWEFAMFRRRWHSLDAPRHISFPDARHAARLAHDGGLRFDGEVPVAFPNGFGGSLPTALQASFSAPIFFATLPLSVLVTRLFPGGNKAFVLVRPEHQASPGRQPLHE